MFGRRDATDHNSPDDREEATRRWLFEGYPSRKTQARVADERFRRDFANRMNTAVNLVQKALRALVIAAIAIVGAVEVVNYEWHRLMDMDTLKPRTLSKPVDGSTQNDEVARVKAACEVRDTALETQLAAVINEDRALRTALSRRPRPLQLVNLAGRTIGSDEVRDASLKGPRMAVNGTAYFKTADGALIAVEGAFTIQLAKPQQSPPPTSDER